jgi:hypothetical protein
VTLEVSTGVFDKFIIFIDIKSAFEDGGKSSENYVMKSKEKKTAMYQYLKMCHRQDEMVTQAAADTIGASLHDFEEAFRKGNWGFLYLSTYAGPDLFFTRDDFVNFSGSNGHRRHSDRKYGFVVQSTAASTYKCLGLVEDFYRTLRNSVDR